MDSDTRQVSPNHDAASAAAESPSRPVAVSGNTFVTDYKVRLSAFEGPLDLLLFLIRRAEIDVHDIPISLIADQYLSYVTGFVNQTDTSKVDLESAGDFLVMAATLMEIKSRMIAWDPNQPAETQTSSDDEAGEDPRADLVRQLLAFKQYRDAAHILESRSEQWQRRFPAAAHHSAQSEAELDPDAPADVSMDELTIQDLIEAFRSIVETVNFERVGEHAVKYDDTPIEIHAEDILDRIREHTNALASSTGQPITMRQIFTGRRRSEMIGLFLALLELVRRRAVAVRQEAILGEIVVEELKDPTGGVPIEASQDVNAASDSTSQSA
ncbi:MAG: segregation/condensation protein A [Planctomycetes bacterium]|nr:segregation/condensation protein A [Planctomycetota bacterium]